MKKPRESEIQGVMRRDKGKCIELRIVEYRPPGRVSGRDGNCGNGGGVAISKAIIWIIFSVSLFLIVCMMYLISLQVLMSYKWYEGLEEYATIRIQ